MENPVYLAKKLHEIKRFDERARELGPEKVREWAEKRARSYEGLGLGGLILDVGCGYGPDMLAISDLCSCELVGFDLSVEAVRLAKKALEGRPVHLLLADATCMPFRDGIFDAANVSYMLHHHPWPVVGRIVSELARVLRPGGKLVVREPCPPDEREALAGEVLEILHDLGALRDLGRSLPDALREFLYLRSALFDFGHLYPTALRRLLESRGFEVVKLEFWDEERDLNALLELAEARARDLDLNEAERAFIAARFRDLREKMALLGARKAREKRLFLVAVKKGRT